MIVLDNSAAVQYYLQNTRNPVISGAREIAVPNHIFVEFVSAMRRLELHRKISTRDALDSIDAFLGLPLLYFDMLEFSRDIWALRHNATAYDACYICLAKALQVPLLSADGGMLRAAKGLATAIPFA